MKKENLPTLRFHEKSCYTCRYYRVSIQKPPNTTTTGDCLFLGRMLSISTNSNDHMGWNRERLCDGWKRRPKKWKVNTEIGVNPYWNDKYISRETQEKIRKRWKNK